MKYGKLFKGYRNDFNIADDFTANKVSELTYKEIRTMAKNLRPKNDQHIPARYMNLNKQMLGHCVYKTLVALYR